MGVDTSRLEPPRDWPFLGWDEDSLRRFLNFVKTDDEGSFRISKWKMLEFVGFEYVQEIARLFGAFESQGDTSVSSLHLAAVLLLCNKGVSVQFKVSECLSLFDWSDAGELTFYDLIFLMQACTQALVYLLPVPEHHNQGLDDLEGFCRKAMSKDSESLEELARWAHANQEVLRLLTLLSPQDADAEAALAQLPPPGAPPQQRALPAVADVEAEGVVASGDAGQEVAREEASVAAGELGSADADGSQADALGDADAEKQDDEAASEPPLFPSETEHERLAEELHQHLGGARQALGLQIAAEERRLRASADAAGRAAAFGRIWAHSLGASLPTLPSSWTTPLQGGPFEQPASAEALRVGLTDWAWILHSAVVEEARYEAALVAAGLFAGETAAAAEQRRGARELAAEELDDWMQTSGDSLAEGGGEAVKLLEAERASLEDIELEAARALEAATTPGIASLRRAQRSSWRLEGAVEYLASLRSGSSVPEAAPQLRQEAEAQLARQLKDLGKLQEAKRVAEGKRTVFLKAFFKREALSAAASNAHDPGAALALRIQDLRRGTGAADAAGAGGAALGHDFGCHAADALEACEPCWRRAEGRLAAASVLRFGGTLDFQLRVQVSQRLDRAARKSEAAQILAGGVDGGRKQEGAARAPRRRIRLLESLLEPMEQIAAEAPPQGQLQAVLPKVLSSAAASLMAAPSHRLLSPAPRSAAARSTITGEPGVDGPPMLDSPEREAALMGSGGSGFDRGADEGAEIADDSSDDGSDSEECWRLHALRFERRACRAALDAAGSALQAGQLPELVQRLRESLAAAERRAAEAPQGRQEAVKRKLEAALDECLAGASSRGEGLQVAVACVSHNLRDAYADAHSASLLPSRSIVASRSSLRTPTLPLEPQPTLPFTADTDCLGFATSGLRRQAAHAAGALRAMEAIRLAAGSGDTAGGEAELLRLAELKAEARLLAALAAHRLACAELEMRALAASGAACGRLPCGRRAVGQEDGAGPAGGLTQELVDAAARVLAACRGVDVRRALDDCAQDACLGPRAAAAVNLAREFGELAAKEVGTEEALAAQAPVVPPLVHWWRPDLMEGPLFVGGGASPCPRCLTVARLTWRHLSGGAEEPPGALLEEHAAAWRLAALADGRSVALEALARGGWGHLLHRQRWQDTQRLAGRLWRSELARQHAALLARSHRDCLVRAQDYLHALDPDDVRFLCLEDLDEQEDALSEDLHAGLDERLHAELPAARDALVDAKLRGCLLEGLREGAEAARLELHVDADPEEALRSPAPAAQVALSFAVEQALTEGRRSKAGLVLAGVDKRLMECRGLLRGIASLRSFVTILHPEAED